MAAAVEVALVVVALVEVALEAVAVLEYSAQSFELASWASISSVVLHFEVRHCRTRG